jgi:DNA-binding MarR family transcriptional regulator
MAKWTFLTNHALVLIFLSKNPKITGQELSRLIGISERSVRRIICDLEKGGYIKKYREGRNIRYFINYKLPFRHHTQQDKEIGLLLKALGLKSKTK